MSYLEFGTLNEEPLPKTAYDYTFSLVLLENDRLITFLLILRKNQVKTKN
jgi:hypothetical protein